jgi:TolB-like protein
MRYVSTLAGLLAMVMGISMVRADVPATQPAAVQTADVYLIPFSPLGGDTTLDWAGKAVQQNLLTDLARAKLSVAASDKPIDNIADAKAAAKTAGAKFVITGTYQVADTQVRFNGQVLDTATGNVIGGISATGAPRDLFSMEDALSAQALQQLKQLPAVANNKAAGQPVTVAAQPPIVVQLVQPAVVQPGTSSSYQGSDLQAYVNSDRTPSTDFNQQTQNSQDRNTYDYGYNNSVYTPFYGGFGYGIGYGYGLIYSVSPGYHYGSGYVDHHRHNDDR